MTFKQKDGERLILGGFLTFSLSACVLSVFSMAVYDVYIIVIAWALILAGLLLTRVTVDLYGNKQLNILLLVYIMLCLMMVVRGPDFRERSASFTIQDWMRAMFFDSMYLIWIFLPLFAMRIIRFRNFSGFNNLIFVAGIFSVAATLLSLPKFSSYVLASQLEDTESLAMLKDCSFAWVFEVFSFFILLLPYIKQRRVRIAIILSFIVNFLAKMFTGRRGDTVMLAVLLFFSFVINLIDARKKFGFRSVLYVVLMAAIVLFAVNSDLSSFFFSRIDEDTRTAVDESLYSSLSPVEFIFGKGLNGNYYYPLESDVVYGGWRYISETGFSTLVLKGGFLMAIIYVLLWLVPAVLGLFKSKNVLSKAIGFYLLWNIIYLYPAGNPQFGFEQLFVWYLAGLVSRTSIRKLDESQVRQIFFSS